MNEYAQQKCILYARKSSESEDRQALSIESQLGVLRDLANRHEIKIIEELTESKSAKEPGRPIFNQMIERIRRGEIDTILCWKLDRLARNPIDQGTIQYLLQKGTLQKIITSERNYLPEDNVLLMNMELGMANQYILDLRKNVMRGNKTKLEMGWLPGKPPIGYLNHPISRTIVRDPERFDLVHKLFKLFLTGAYSPLLLVRAAHEELHLTLPKNSSGVGKDLSRSYIYDFLRDPFYCGTIVRKGERYRGSHERMITTIQHEEVLKLLNRQEKSDSSTKEDKNLFPLGGTIRCGCGRMITAYAVKKKDGKCYRFYRCSRKTYLDGVRCLKTNIKAEILEDQVKNLIEKIILPQPLADWIKVWAKFGNFQESFITQLEMEGLHKEKERITKQLQNLLSLVVDGTVAKQDYEFERKRLNDELQNVKDRIQKNDERIQEWERAVCDVLDLAVIARRLYESSNIQDKKLVLRGIGSNFILKDRKLTIEVKKPFQVIMDHQITLTPQDEQDLTLATLQITQNPSQTRDFVNGHPPFDEKFGLWWSLAEQVLKNVWEEKMVSHA